MTLGKKILIGFVVCGIILIGVAIYTFDNREKFVASNEWVEHTHEVINKFNEIKTAVVDAETGGRGYVISGNEAFLAPYLSAQKTVFEHLTGLRELTSDNPAQQKRTDDLEKGIRQYMDYLNELLEIRKKDAEKAFAIVSSGQGKNITDNIRRIIDEGRENEQLLLNDRKEQSKAEAGNFNLVFALLLVVIAVILLVVYYIIITNLRALRRAEKANGFIAFEVKDSGIGIPKEKHTLIFDAFQQADGSTRRKYGGTDLGLSISREIARMLGGEIILQSEQGKGSSFTVILPVGL